jgi:fructokinase
MTEPADPGRTVLVVGEALVDVVHRRDGRIDEVPGGSPANVALALGRLGRHPLLVTRLGDDQRGRAVRDWLAAAAVELVGGLLVGVRTSTATAMLDETGAASYVFDLEWAVGDDVTERAAVVHTGSIATLVGPGADDVLRLIEARRHGATITFDPNVRPSLIANPDLARARVQRMLRLADVVKASDEDLRWLHPGRELHEIAAEWQAGGPALVVVTRGGQGAFAITDAGHIDVPAAPVDVVDTVGAGDTFMGALIDGLIGHGLAGADRSVALRAVAPESLAQILRRSAIAAAITVSREGADVPWLAEVDAATAKFPDLSVTARLKG